MPSSTHQPSASPRPPSPDAFTGSLITGTGSGTAPATSAAPLPPPAPPLPPPAPPLPSQRYVQRAATAFGRLAHPFLYASRPSSAQGHRDGARRPTGLRPSVRRSSSPSSSRSATHKTGIPIAALDISPERTHAVLAGRDILKTIKIADATCTEEFNLRSKLSTYASAHNASRDAVSAQHRDQLAAHDVKWSRGIFSSTVATAAANGRIVIYDLNRPSVEIGRLHEHSRQVHRIAFNPHQGALLISGSQDGTVRMWDMRDLASDRPVRATGSIKRFYCHSDGVRDLRWSPSDGVEFAVGTDSGVIQRWDFRRENAPILKLNAHDKTCMTLDWHPGGRYLASGGADKLVKVWDFKSSDRRMKAQWQLRAPQAVSKIRWRPSAAAAAAASGGEESQDFRHVTSLATSYDGKDPRIHVWDFRRPHVPFQEIDKYDSAPSDMVWHSEDLLWSVNSAGVFTQSDLKFATTPLDKVNVNVLTTGPDGQFCYFSEHRPRKQISIPESKEQFLEGTDSQGSSGEKLQSSSDPTNAGGEDGLTISASLKRRRQRFASTRPPSHAFMTNSVFESEFRLSDKNLLEALFHSTQISATGRILGVFDSESFKTLATAYSLPSWPEHSTGDEIVESVRGCFERNAILAAQTGQYRLAQTWGIIGHAACSELKLKLDAAASPEFQKKHAIRWVDDPHATAKSRARDAKPPAITSPQDTTSTVATPLARPIRGKPSISSLEAQALDSAPKQDKISFVAPAWESPKKADPEHGPAKAHSDQAGRKPFKADATDFSPTFEFPDLERQLQERRDAMNSYRAKPRSLLRLDNPMEESRSPLSMPPLDRHDSTESLQMFSGSQDSEPRSVPFTGSFDDSRRSDASVAVSFGSKEFADESRRGPDYSADRNPSIDFPSVTDEPDAPPIPFPASFSHMSPSAQDEPEVARSLKGTGFMPVKRPSVTLLPIISINRTTFDNKETHHTPESALALFGDSPNRSDNPAPWTLPALLPPLLAYHLDTLCDTQLPAFVTLALFRFFPSLFDPPERAEAYLLAYHELLASLKLFPSAAALRNAWHPLFPELSAESTAEQGRGTDKDRAALWCERCARPVKGDVSGWCERCRTHWGPCALCELPEPPRAADLGLPAPDSADEDAEEERSQEAAAQAPAQRPPRDTRLWHWCQGCGHGGHAACMRAWWAASGEDGEAGGLSGGACAVAGCEHDCVAGARRAARLKALERRRARSVTPVVRDDWVASESRAVGSATRSLVSEGTAASTGASSAALARSASASGSSAAKHAGGVGNGGPKGARGKGENGGGRAVDRRGAGDGGFASASRRRGSGPGKLGSGSLESAGAAGGESAGRDPSSFGAERPRPSLDQGGRSLSGGGRRVRLAVPAEGEGEGEGQDAGEVDRAMRGVSEPP